MINLVIILCISTEIRLLYASIITDNYNGIPPDVEDTSNAVTVKSVFTKAYRIANKLVPYSRIGTFHTVVLPAGLATDVILRLQEKYRLAENDDYETVNEAWQAITIKLPESTSIPYALSPPRKSYTYKDHFLTTKLKYRTWSHAYVTDQLMMIYEALNITPRYHHNGSTQAYWYKTMFPFIYRAVEDESTSTTTTTTTDTATVTAIATATVTATATATAIARATATATTTSTATSTTLANAKNWICYVCGKNETKFGSSLCHDTFESGKSVEFKHKMRYRCKGHVSAINQCFKRFLDIGEYNERGCRDIPPRKSGKTYVSKRLRVLEKMLDGVVDGCVFSPHAYLVPYSRTIQLYARFYVCVCKGTLCNAAAASEPWSLLFSVALLMSLVLIPTPG